MTSQIDANRRTFKIPGWIVLIVFTVAVNVFAIWWSQRIIWPAPQEGAVWAMPKSLKTMSGEPLDLQKALGSNKLVLFNIWASWCAPCEAEFPSLLSMASEFEKDGEIVVVAVSVDEDKAAVEKFMKKFKTPGNFILAHDENKSFSESIGTFKLPESYLVDIKQNKVVKKFVGTYDWYDRGMLQFLRSVK